MFGAGEGFAVGVGCCARASDDTVGDAIIDAMAMSRKMTTLVFSGSRGNCGLRIDMRHLLVCGRAIQTEKSNA